MNPMTSILIKLSARITTGAVLVFALLAGSASLTWAQSATEGTKPVSQMTAEELAAYIKVQQIQLDAVKQARDEQKAKHAEVQEALTERQAELNEIVTELSELCSERQALDPDDSEPCLPDDS